MFMQVRFSDASSGKRPPTAVMVHGILGNRRNMQAFAKRLSEVSLLLFKCILLHAQKDAFANASTQASEASGVLADLHNYFGTWQAASYAFATVSALNDVWHAS